MIDNQTIGKNGQFWSDLLDALVHISYYRRNISNFCVFCCKLRPSLFLRVPSRHPKLIIKIDRGYFAYFFCCWEGWAKIMAEGVATKPVFGISAVSHFYWFSSPWTGSARIQKGDNILKLNSAPLDDRWERCLFWEVIKVSPLHGCWRLPAVDKQRALVCVMGIKLFLVAVCHDNQMY